MKTKKLYPILLVALLVALLGILTLGVSAEGEPTVPTTEYAFQIFLKESVTSLPVEAIEGLDAALYADAKIEGDRFYLKLPVITNPMHITASVFINDDESGLHHDMEVWLEKLAPEKPYSQYRHNGYEDNADAHLKRSVMGREVVIAVTDGRLDFGPWEQIFYFEFDGKRNKRVLIKIIGE